MSQRKMCIRAIFRFARQKIPDGAQGRTGLVLQRWRKSNKSSAMRGLEKGVQRPGWCWMLVWCSLKISRIDAFRWDYNHHLGVLQIGTPIAGWLIGENPTKMHDFGVPPFQETLIESRPGARCHPIWDGEPFPRNPRSLGVVGRIW